MTFGEFNQYVELTLKECDAILCKKGPEYANSEDRFGNFKRLAAQLDTTEQKIAWIYLFKHLDSIAEAIRTNQYTGRSELFNLRICDAINYLLLIGGITEEQLLAQQELDRFKFEVQKGTDAWPSKDKPTAHLQGSPGFPGMRD